MSDQPTPWASPDGSAAAGPPADATPAGPAPGCPAPAGPADRAPGPAGSPDRPAFSAPPGWGGPPAAAPGGAATAALRPGVVPLRPLGLGELLDGAVTLLRRYPRPALGYSAAVAVVATGLNLLLTLTALRPLLDLGSGDLAAADPAQLESALGGAAVGGGATLVVQLLGTLVLTGVMTVIAGRAVLGEPMTARDVWVQLRPALGRLLLVALLTTAVVDGVVALAVGLAAATAVLAGPAGLLLGVPLALAGVGLAVYLYVRWSLAPAAALLERAPVRVSLRRSGVLVRRSWWRVLGILLLTFVIAAFVRQVLQVPFLALGATSGGFGALLSGQGGTRLLVLSSLAGGFSQALVAPFTAGVTALLYIDRRMRAEGLDVALTAAAAQR